MAVATRLIHELECVLLGGLLLSLGKQDHLEFSCELQMLPVLHFLIINCESTTGAVLQKLFVGEQQGEVLSYFHRQTLEMQKATVRHHLLGNLYVYFPT